MRTNEKDIELLRATCAAMNHNIETAGRDEYERDHADQYNKGMAQVRYLATNIWNLGLFDTDESGWLKTPEPGSKKDTYVRIAIKLHAERKNRAFHRLFVNFNVDNFMTAVRFENTWMKYLKERLDA